MQKAKHCRDCRFAKCKPFTGKMVWNDRMRNKSDDLGVLFDLTAMTQNSAVLGPVRCSMDQWEFHGKAELKRKVRTLRTVATVRNIMLPENNMGKMAKTCQYFDDMGENAHA